MLITHIIMHKVNIYHNYCATNFLLTEIRFLLTLVSFVHSFIRPFLYRPFKSSTTQRRSRLQHGYCSGVTPQSAQATAGKGLPQGPYGAARGGVDPPPLRLK